MLPHSCKSFALLILLHAITVIVVGFSFSFEASDHVIFSTPRYFLFTNTILLKQIGYIAGGSE